MTENFLYYDCFAGISGDMNLAALIDLGVDSNYLKNELNKLNIGAYEMKISKDSRKGIFGTRVDVIIENEEHHHHGHEHSHNHVHHTHNHNERSFSELKEIIQLSDLLSFVKEKSIAIFQKLAEAEGKIHNIPVNEVHFHEVGAIDSIVDIVGAAICIDYLKPAKIVTSRIELGSGMVKCSHGLFPVPAPATLEVLKGIPVKSGNIPFESTTPTGAAILAVITDEFIENQNYTVEKTGYGIGHKDGEIPNVLRAMLCKTNTNTFNTEMVSIIECNIDDMNPEIYDYLFENLFNIGALDVFLVPIQMKKSRPANMLSVICNQNIKEIIVKFILKETSTLGVRISELSRVILNREIFGVETSLGKIKVKHSWSGSEISKYKPEYDDCVRISIEKNIPLIKVLEILNSEIILHINNK
jgi:uncharacterized protein (TIGR00299 family) protein